MRFTSKMYSMSEVDIDLSENRTISADESGDMKIDLSGRDLESIIVQEEWNDIREWEGDSEYESMDEQAEQLDDEEDEAEQQREIRVSQRINKGVPPSRLIEEIIAVSNHDRTKDVDRGHG